MNTQPRKPDQVLLALFGGLVVFGLVMVYSASFVVGYTQYESATYWVKRQAMWAIASGVALLAVMRFDYRNLRRLSIPLMGLTLILLVLVLLLPGHITEANGAARWINIGPVGLQPSEFAKFAAIIYFADWLSRRGSKIQRFMTGLLPFGIMLGLLAGLVLIEPDMGTTIVLVAISSAILFVSGASLSHLGVATLLTLSVGWAAVTSAGYRLQRVLVWQDPWAYADAGGYQPLHSLYALGSGGLWGVGLGQSRQKFHWLPFAHTDAILAVIGEELGLITTLLLLLAFATIAVRGYRIATRTSDPFAALIAVGVTTWIVGQALVNVGVVSTLIPFTGITLPFISYGGSSLLTLTMAAGLLLSVSRYAPLKHTEELHESSFPGFPSLRNSAAAHAMRWWNWRPRLSGARHRQRPADPSVPRSVAVGNSFSGTWRKRFSNEKRSGRSRVRSRNDPNRR